MTSAVMTSAVMTNDTTDRRIAVGCYQNALVRIPEVLELAAESCRAPMAALKLISGGSAQFAASLGIRTTHDVPRSTSLCRVVSTSDQAIVVDDASADPRFRHHPMVTGPDHARFIGAAPLHHDGQIIGALCVFDDDPQRHDTELTGRLLTRIARQIDAETNLRHLLNRQPLPITADHDDVIAAISHELRTPLTSIRGNLELLADIPGSIAPPAQRRIDTITRNTDRLWRTIENLLHTAGQQLHEPVGRQSAIDLRTVVSAAVSATPDPAGQIHTTLPTHPAVVTADPALLQTAVEQLLHNALLFAGPDAPVEISLNAGPQPTLTIRDHGPGLDPAQLQHLGTPFRRGEHADRDQIPGLGLGLAISRRILHAQNATLTLHNTPGTGATASITFTV